MMTPDFFAACVYIICVPPAPPKAAVGVKADSGTPIPPPESEEEDAEEALGKSGTREIAAATLRRPAAMATPGIGSAALISSFFTCCPGATVPTAALTSHPFLSNSWSSSAAAPATCGVAIDVPDRVT